MGTFFIVVGLYALLVGIISIIKPLVRLKINNRKTGAIVSAVGLAMFFTGAVMIGSEEIADEKLVAELSEKQAKKAGYSSVEEYEAVKKVDEELKKAQVWSEEMRAVMIEKIDNQADRLRLKEIITDVAGEACVQQQASESQLGKASETWTACTLRWERRVESCLVQKFTGNEPFLCGKELQAYDRFMRG